MSDVLLQTKHSDGSKLFRLLDNKPPSTNPEWWQHHWDFKANILREPSWMHWRLRSSKRRSSRRPSRSQWARSGRCNRRLVHLVQLAVSSLIAPLLHATELSSRSVLYRLFCDGCWKYFIRFLQVGGWFLSWFEWGTLPFIGEKWEKSSPMQWTDGLRMRERSLRHAEVINLHAHEPAMDSALFFSFFWLVAHFVCTLDYCTCWLTDKRRRWKCTGLQQRPGISSESITGRLAGRPAGWPGVEGCLTPAHHLHSDELLMCGLIGGSSNWCQ